MATSGFDALEETKDFYDHKFEFHNMALDGVDNDALEETKLMTTSQVCGKDFYDHKSEFHNLALGQEHEEMLTSKLTILDGEDTQVALDNKALELTKDVTVETTTLTNITHKEKTIAVERDILHKINLKKLQIMENSGFDALDGMDNEDETEKEVVTYELARRDTNKKLKRKENKTKNHGATKRLHQFKMAANHVTEMAAYTPDNNWREIEDVKLRSLLPNSQLYFSTRKLETILVHDCETNSYKHQLTVNYLNMETESSKLLQHGHNVERQNLNTLALLAKTH